MKKLIVIPFLISLVPTLLQAQGVILSEDWEGLATGSYSSQTRAPFSSVSTSGGALTIVEDSGDLFGNGTSNLFLDHIDSSTSQSTELRDTTVSGMTQLHTLSFRLYEPDVVNRDGAFIVRIGDGIGSSDAAVDINFNDGTVGGNGLSSPVVGAYSLDSAFGIDLVVNNTGATVSNYHDGNSVANDTYDVWLTNGATTTLIIDDLAFRNNIATINRIDLRTFSGARQEMYIDDITLYDSAYVSFAIPEPSAYAYGLGIIAGLVVLRRRIG